MKKSDSKEDINDIAIRTVNSLGLIGSAVASKAQVKKLKSIDKSLAVATSSVLKIRSIFPKFIAAILPSGTPNITSSIATGGTAVNKPEKDAKPNVSSLSALGSLLKLALLAAIPFLLPEEAKAKFRVMIEELLADFGVSREGLSKTINLIKIAGVTLAAVFAVSKLVQVYRILRRVVAIGGIVRNILTMLVASDVLDSIFDRQKGSDKGKGGGKGPSGTSRPTPPSTPPGPAAPETPTGSGRAPGGVIITPDQGRAPPAPPPKSPSEYTKKQGPMTPAEQSRRRAQSEFDRLRQGAAQKSKNAQDFLRKTTPPPPPAKPSVSALPEIVDSTSKLTKAAAALNGAFVGLNTGLDAVDAYKRFQRDDYVGGTISTAASVAGAAAVTGLVLGTAVLSAPAVTALSIAAAALGIGNLLLDSVKTSDWWTKRNERVARYHFTDEQIRTTPIFDVYGNVIDMGNNTSAQFLATSQEQAIEKKLKTTHYLIQNNVNVNNNTTNVYPPRRF